MSKQKIKGFWEKNPPQVWYSKKEEGTKAYFEDIALHRYNIQYRYLPKVAEFKTHNNERVLEIGCGIGTDGLQFALNGADYTGIDLTKRAIETAKQQFKLFDVKGVHLQADAENLPFNDNTFNLVYSFGVLHHTPNMKKAFEEVYRVLKPGGKAIIMLYARGWKHWLIRVLWGGFFHLDFLKLGFQGTYNKWSDGKQLTYMVTRKKIKFLTGKFKKESVKMYRLGAFFDWGTTFPRWLVKFLYFIKLEGIVGENWVIKVKK